MSGIDDFKVEAVQTSHELRRAALGHEQSMKRRFNVWSLIFLAFCTSVTWEVICATMTQSLLTGGSSSMVWGFAASAIGALAIALSLSEYASILPTAGGQYHYVAALSPPKYARALSWLAGWATIWSWVLSALSGIFSNAMQIQAYVILFTPGYVYQRWHTSLVVIAIATWATALSIVGIKWLPRIMYLGIVLHIAGYIATIVYLLASVYPKNSASFVFGDLTNLSGWKSDGVAWSVGLMSSAIGFVNWDSSTHMAEEMQNAARDLPRTLYGCVALSGLLTFPWVIALMFCMTDVQSIVEGPVGTISPLVQLIYNVSGGDQATTIGMTSFFLILSLSVSGPGVMSATSRIVWSFACEGGMPSPFTRIHSRWEVPVNALLLVWFVVSALSLIYIGNSTAFYGISSGVTIVMIFSYCLPIVLNLGWGIDGNKLKRGPFTLGRWARAINIFAFCWCLYLIVFMTFPTVMPVSGSTMNYGVVLFGVCVLIIPVVTWFSYGRRSYLGVLGEHIIAIEGFGGEALQPEDKAMSGKD
ncbi:Amino acid/polyamine transporter I [Penicillium longicatenatum]|uniref:Amino acid/polyamine transporter I n=1 Tax=Penicillium longicatenatum TaxID=1561947 RepID=UPI0025494594|nr:Amino acid/polyamine transporter I [Penicillium longicatenatum]KAJ5661147.1 Amino acid/polyamine transporter I [Penicillium longicatenatum]